MVTSQNGDSTTNHSLSIPLQRCPHLALIQNTPKGRGVFATQPISSGTIIDTCPVLILDPHENKEHIAKTCLYHYTYNWPLINATTGKRTGTTQAVIFGLGSMFNHSLRNQNVGWTRDLENQVIIYRALRDIDEGEELCISYGYHLTFTDADANTSCEGEEDEDEEDEELVLARIDLDLDTR